MHGPNVAFLNEVERICFNNFKHYANCDAFLASILLFPECIQKKSDYYATVELIDIDKRGQMCIDEASENEPNVSVIEYLNEKCIKQALTFAAAA